MKILISVIVLLIMAIACGIAEEHFSKRFAMVVAVFMGATGVIVGLWLAKP